MHDILVLYYSHRGSVRALAERIARGIESVSGVQAQSAHRPPCIHDLRSDCRRRSRDAGAPLRRSSPTSTNACRPGARQPGTLRQHGGADEVFLGWHASLPGRTAHWSASRPASSRPAAASMAATNPRCSRMMLAAHASWHAGHAGLPFTEPDVAPYPARRWHALWRQPCCRQPTAVRQLSETESRLAFAQGRRLANIALKLSRP